MNKVYITKTSSFLPNEKVENDAMEDFLGMVNGKPSKARRIVLRNNGIQERYYALDKEGKPTHQNAEMASLSIRGLFDDPEELKNVDLLSCGTSSPDQMMPSHAIMTHGYLKETDNIEVNSAAGVCAAGMHAFKYAFLSVMTGQKQLAVACASERPSQIMQAVNFDKEAEKLVSMEENPFISFDKEFLRWMLSDGAGAFLLQSEPREGEINLEINWIESFSYANEIEPCMYMAAEKDAEGNLISYKEFDSNDLIEKSIFSIKQDVKLLSENIINFGYDKLAETFSRHNFKAEQIDYFLPHISSYFFESKIEEALEKHNINIPKEKWFTNLRTKGNVGSASIYLMVDELVRSKKLKKGEKILMLVPESSRFAYVYCLLTVH